VWLINRPAGRLFMLVGGRIEFIIIGVPQIRRIRKQTTARASKHVDTRLETAAVPISRVLEVRLVGTLDFRGLCVASVFGWAKNATSSPAFWLHDERKVLIPHKTKNARCSGVQLEEKRDPGHKYWHSKNNTCTRVRLCEWAGTCFSACLSIFCEWTGERASLAPINRHLVLIFGPRVNVITPEWRPPSIRSCCPWRRTTFSSMPVSNSPPKTH